MKMPRDLNLDEDERSEEEKAQDEAEAEAEVREHMARLRLGGGEAQLALESSKKAFMTGAHVATSEETVILPAPVDEKRDGKVLDTMVEERERFDFSFEVKRLTLQVEKKVVQAVDGERHVVSASTAAFGPRGYAVRRRAGAAVHRLARDLYPARPHQALDPILDLHHVPDHHRVDPSQLARLAIGAELLEHPALQAALSQLLGQTEGVALVALGALGFPSR